MSDSPADVVTEPSVVPTPVVEAPPAATEPSAKLPSLNPANERNMDLRALMRLPKSDSSTAESGGTAHQPDLARMNFANMDAKRLAEVTALREDIQQAKTTV